MVDQQVQRRFPSTKRGIFLEQFHLLHICSCFLQVSIFVTFSIRYDLGHKLHLWLSKQRKFSGAHFLMIKLVTAFKDPLFPFFPGSNKIEFLKIVDSHGSFNFK